LGRGATFIVELPIVSENKQLEMPEPVVRETRKVAKAKILVVDDELMVRQFVSQILIEEGHEVEVAESAEGALEEVNTKEYHAIMLDIKMPGMSGIELYQHFQKISPLLADKVVFITGDVMGTGTMAFLSKTKAPYIIKPFDAKQLKTQINRVLDSG
jgi:two-component system NtrC family sensor kinase